MKGFIISIVYQFLLCSRRMKFLGHAVYMRGTRNAYRVLVGKPEDKWPLRRFRYNW
jgi:hypothetical protein